MKTKGVLTAMTKKRKKAKKRSPTKIGASTATPTLRFSPTAWAKLLFLRDLGDTEVGGFGISQADDLLCVGDVRLVRQTTSEVTVAFDDEAVADLFDQQVDQGLRVEQFARIWLHTHPGDNPNPSAVDEDTFANVFGRSDWSLMFILAQSGDHYARLQFNVGPSGSLEIPAEVDFTEPFTQSQHEAWEEEYAACVQPEPLLVSRNSLDSTEGPWDLDDVLADPVPQQLDAWDEVESNWPRLAGTLNEL